MAYKPTPKELLELIQSIEAGGSDASPLRSALASLPQTAQPRRRFQCEEGEEPTTSERLNNEVGDLFPDGITDELLTKLIEIDGNHSLKELQAMCKQTGLSPNGHKKELAAKLVAKGIL